MDSVLEQVIAGIGPLNLEKTGECYAKLSSLVVPQDGNLTYLAGRIAGVSDTLQPSLLKKAVVLFAADHAVDGGENKTKGMGSKAAALEIAAGKGHINKVAHQIGAGVLLLDMGLEQNIPESEGVQDLKVMHGSHFWVKGPAMTEDQMLDAMFSGLQIGENLADEHYNALGLGNIGERGLLTAFILTAAFFRDSMNDLPSHMKSQGKLEQLTALMDRLGLDAGDPLDLLRRAGSPDIAAMVGLILAAAHRRLLVVFDNAVTGAAVLLSRALCSQVDDYVIPSARYAEPVHQMQMKKMGLKAFFETGQDTDQGMGSVIGLSLLDAAVDMMNKELK
ncbi:nicotinate-nucleotide--dimethylbenzimidazole phosphoribosyltransferase [uncultured Megasphaera sp.]|uniref:nicotinate-nucleotide--dimethylbenzimidazole phosphoribosyltransferase n=1 Tax=uncultured Megasphaera sp. TaxID=165188 RepID=UPI002593382F|nr:nicotinate-nucleotide--dimethylbenzimidazole phosphoribosyltransferase [uncultured Megasphaera sp.]